MSDNILSVKDLSISFLENGKLNIVVNKISFNLKLGETLSLVGESGSGKSLTSLSTVSLLPQNAIVEGSILFNDKEIHKQYIDFFQKSLEAAYKKELLPKNWEPIQ